MAADARSGGWSGERFDEKAIYQFVAMLQNTGDALSSMTLMWNALFFSLQYLYGGLYVPSDGLMLNSLDTFLLPHQSMRTTNIFMERIL